MASDATPRVKVCCISSGPGVIDETLIAIVRPFGVDLCTGVRDGGALSARELDEFFSAARRGGVPSLRD